MKLTIFHDLLYFQKLVYNNGFFSMKMSTLSKNINETFFETENTHKENYVLLF